MAELPEGQTIIFSAEDKEIQDCMIYLEMKDQRKSLEDIGAHFGYKSRQGMANKRERWIRDGIMEKARRRYYIPKGEEIAAATSRVMDDVPAMLDRMVKIVKLGREKNAIEAFKLLHDIVIKPNMDAQPDQTNHEQNYANRSIKGLPDPMVVSLPSTQSQEAAQQANPSSLLLELPVLPPTVPVLSEMDAQSSDT